MISDNKGLQACYLRQYNATQIRQTICLFGLDVGSDNGFAGLSQFATYSYPFKDCPVETSCVSVMWKSKKIGGAPNKQTVGVFCNNRKEVKWRRAGSDNGFTGSPAHNGQL